MTPSEKKIIESMIAKAKDDIIKAINKEKKVKKDDGKRTAKSVDG